ncbi:RBP11-like subunits of RNA polymerase [Pyrrhoderma noxium]|uniref:RBP11-like subunits of RNA polymerase n=1 Tax=Pyrrhoderma noxium TaxID=2282107 RepID=A0A286U6Z1_9AGAM|nr:RBP11-like subunits of RNA polymerase [Pyrrhoderma noxium]
MNAIQRHELYVLEQGENPVEVFEDTKIPNAATIKIVKQDHTLANMLRQQLLLNPSVLFAGYKNKFVVEFQYREREQDVLGVGVGVGVGGGMGMGMGMGMGGGAGGGLLGGPGMGAPGMNVGSAGAGGGAGAGRAGAGGAGGGMDGTYGEESAWSGKDYLNDI